MFSFRSRFVWYTSMLALVMWSVAFAQTATLYGKVTAADCPSDPRMGMPCRIAPIVGCTITIYTDIDKPIPPLEGPAAMIYPPSAGLTAVSDAKGEFSIKFNPALAKGSQILINAHAKGYDWYSSIMTISGRAKDTVNISLTPAAPPAAGAVYEIAGTAWTSDCPPNRAMGLPCALTPAPNCTLTFYISPRRFADLPVSSEPGQTSPAYAPLQAITNDKGAYRLALDPPVAAGTEITAYAQKDGYLPYRNSMILGGDSVAVMDIFLEEGTLPPPPVPVGYASVSGTVSWSDPKSLLAVMTPVSNCTVYVYAGAITTPVYFEMNPDGSVSGGGTFGTTPANPGVSTGVVYPDQIYTYLAVTDQQGRYAIDSIQIWGDPAAKQASFVFSAFKAGIGSAEVTAMLEAGKSSIVDLYLQPAPPPPEPVGTATISGAVLKRNCRATAKVDPQCLLEPVARCTVLVSAAYVPYLTVRSDAYLPPTLEKTYFAVTDDKGMYTIRGIELMSDQYAVIVMAQKDGLFGSSTTTLLVNQTATADVILDELPYVLVDSGGVVDTIRTAEAAFYIQNKHDLMPVKRPAIKDGAAHVTQGVISFIDGSLRLAVPAAQAVTIAVYAPNGRKIGAVVEQRQFAAGAHTVQLPKLTAGRAVIRVTGNKGLSAAALVLAQ